MSDLVLGLTAFGISVLAAAVAVFEAWMRWGVR